LHQLIVDVELEAILAFGPAIRGAAQSDARAGIGRGRDGLGLVDDEIRVDEIADVFRNPCDAHSRTFRKVVAMPADVDVRRIGFEFGLQSATGIAGDFDDEFLCRSLIGIRRSWWRRWFRNRSGRSGSSCRWWHR